MSTLTEYRQRFWGYVDQSAGPAECWPWTGPQNGHGYGRFYTRRLEPRQHAAHRLVWQLLRGPIPSNRELDHLCRNRICVNVRHLEVVTSRENTLRGEGPTARKAHQHTCERGGHPLDGTYRRKSGRVVRYCLTCNRERAAARRANTH